jgi:hypothetical protein
MVRSATRCSRHSAPGLEALPKVGLVLGLGLTLVLNLAPALALVLAEEVGQIHE